MIQVIDASILCVHGGLSPDIPTLDQVRTISRAQEVPHEGAFCGMSSFMEPIPQSEQRVQVR
jgi:diadenosine tetraphosphatase ApaH/serine/threonine PP2A family protein phosphatase